MFGHFGAIFDHFWLFLAILGPVKKLSQTSHVTTQNDRERGRISMAMVSKVIFHTFRSFLVILGHFLLFLAILGPVKKIVTE